MKKTNIISKLEKNEFLDFESFIRSVDDTRECFIPCESVIYDEAEVININDFFRGGGKKIHNGRIDFVVNQIRFRTFVDIKDSDKLYVFLNGAKKNRTPEFNRWSYYKYTDATIINIADPMYDLYEKLTLGWYYGNDEVNLREYVALLIQKVAKYLSIDNSNIIIIGSSGGGAATFEVGYYLPKCTTISINAQIKLMDYGIYGKELEDVVGIKIGEDVFHRDDALWYINNSRCRNLIIMNMRSEVDIKQLQRIKDSLGVRLYYGMNIINDDTLIWLYDAYASPYVSPHNTQDNKCIFFVLDYMIQNNFDIPYLKDLVIIVNEFWRKGWQQELKYRSEKISLYQLKKIQNMNRNIALFGTGDIANGLNDKYFDIQNENYYNISIAFDNDTKKIGGLYKGIKILNPNTYQSWNNCFVIIAVKNKIEEIIKQLETYGLIRGQNFITYHELYE